jgi:maltose alpha-D-glucosyltransferase/alpha-amylase
MKRKTAKFATGLTNEPAWYKDAIIYEVRTRSYFDSNDDGVGDLSGLASKLDYIHDLGVTAIWLLPFYPSPGRDDGYDISDYTDVHPEVGTLADFEYLLEQAHRRGIRVITELVLNHTSDQHPWFQRARRAPPGSPERDYYVWSDTPERYREARIIFRDFEPSNWSWDPVAKAYYWHRFYSHQPDLNFQSPAVQEALLGVVDFWLAKGVDGLRLDAVPYLYEEEGTSCENLPQTHAFLRKLRAHMDSRFENRMLLAEANQWPEDAAAYFGHGDECHMNFHFPLMPRLFMAIHQEDRLPIVDIFAQTPVVDRSCQWALFLRNHDELTLEMVSDEERDYMYRAYAHEGAMRINLGIRRRLAPLVENNRRKIELLNALLFSLPGTPVLYYGDEIGMGDNVYLGDRNGVRTPMQWNMDRNAGFSRANPQRLILPVVIDPHYHYESLNVENQQQNASSLLWWTKRLIAIRKRFTAFGRGTMEFLSPSNPHVLACVRRHEQECVLVVANLSRFAQYVELDLSPYKGWSVSEPFGDSPFPPVAEGPYVLTLGPHAFYWLALEAPGGEVDRPVPSRGDAIAGADVEAIVRSGRVDVALYSFLESRVWMGRSARSMVAVRVDDVVRLGTAPDAIWITLLRVDTSDGDSTTCLVPLAFVPLEREAPPGTVVAYVELGAGASPVKGALVDALDDPASSRLLFSILATQPLGAGARGEIAVTLTGETALTAAGSGLEPWKLGRERYDTTMRFGDRFVLRVFRHVDEGITPELELERHLAEGGADLAPPLCGVVELRRPRAEPLTLALVQGFVPHVANGWAIASQELGRYFERVLARGSAEARPLEAPLDSPLVLAGSEPQDAVRDAIGGYRDIAAQLGRRVAELHGALARPTLDPAFAPEPYTATDRRSKYQTLRSLTGRVLRVLRQRLPQLSPRTRALAETALAGEALVLRAFEPLLHVRMDAVRMRVHGRLHLGHVLFTGARFVVTDMGGSRELTLAERRRKRSPMRDLASMVRSFESVSIRVLYDTAVVRDTDLEAARPWAFHWSTWVSAAFLRAYVNAAGDARFVPSDREEAVVLFDTFSVERALFQLQAAMEDPLNEVSLWAHLVGFERTLAALRATANP